MKFTPARAALISLTLGVCSVGFAQENVPIEYYRPLRNSVSVGVRMIGGNSTVKFRNLGSIPNRGLGGANSALGRAYDNGRWSAEPTGDELRASDRLGDESYGVNTATTVTEGTKVTKTYTDRIYLGRSGISWLMWWSSPIPMPPPLT
jgi:hypothetical protein